MWSEAVVVGAGGGSQGRLPTHRTESGPSVSYRGTLTML